MQSCLWVRRAAQISVNGGIREREDRREDRREEHLCLRRSHEPCTNTHAHRWTKGRSDLSLTPVYGTKPIRTGKTPSG